MKLKVFKSVKDVPLKTKENTGGDFKMLSTTHKIMKEFFLSRLVPLWKIWINAL